MKTGINFERCNVASAEEHNTRAPEYMAAINASSNKKYSVFEDRTSMNNSWVNPEYSGKTLTEILDELRDLYRSKLHQAPQENDRIREIHDKKSGMKKTVRNAGWSPIREGVCPIKPETTISDFHPFTEWLQSKGLRIIRIDLHHDEGHIDLLTNERLYNHHGHIIVDWIDHDTGKSVKLNKKDTSEMQTKLAASLGMERGTPKDISGADHLKPDQQRAKATAEMIKELEGKLAGLQVKLSEAEQCASYAQNTIRESCRQLQEIGNYTVQNFDILRDEGAVSPTVKEIEDRDELKKESDRDLSNMEQQDMINEQVILRNMILQCERAVERICKKRQSLAKNIPFFTRKRLVHEAKLQANVAEANEKADAAKIEADEAKRAAASVLNEALVREREAKDKNAKLDAAVNEAREAGYLAGTKSTEEKLQKQYESDIIIINAEKERLREQNMKYKSEVDDLRQELNDLKSTIWEQSVETNKALIKKFGASVFEQAELDYDITAHNSWTAAKEELLEEQQSDIKKRGMRQ